MFAFLSSIGISIYVAIGFLVVFIIARFIDCGWWDTAIFGGFLVIRGIIYIWQGSGIGIGALLIVAGFAFCALSAQSG
ncbi:MAG: hypothetical protein EOL97_07050 [Spirochaetia bacterium]|nr:hypothetical protein [Spirochaetia bacterium]